MVAHPDIGQYLSFLLLGLALLLVSQPVAMYHLTHTITSSFFMDNIYLEGTFLAGKRNITELEGTFLAGKRNKPEGAFLAIKRNKTELEGTFLAGKRNFQGTSQPFRDCVNSFSPAAPAEAMPKFFLHKLHTNRISVPIHEKKLTMLQKHSVAEMGFHESPLTSQPLSIKGLSRGEWSVG